MNLKVLSHIAQADTAYMMVAALLPIQKCNSVTTPSLEAALGGLHWRAQ